MRQQDSTAGRPDGARISSPRRRTQLALALALCAVFMAPAQADTYPSKAVKVISPYPPGGGLDAVLRPLLQKVGDILGQNFFVDNKPGANGIIGIEAGVRSAPDGYTLIGVTSGSATMNPNVYSKMPYDPARDLQPIVNVASAKFMLMVNPTLPVNNVTELISYLKSSNGSVAYGSAGVGGPHHFGGETFLLATGTKMIHVPYRGSQPMMTDLMGGQVKVAFDSVVSAMPWVKSGKLRAMGVASPTRSSVAPDMPTLAEGGGPAFDLTSWYGIMAPAGVPPEIISKVNAAVRQALADPQLQANYAAMGVEIIGSTTAQFATQIKEDTVRWGKVAKEANIRAD